VPKIVDPTTRRAEVVEAVFRIAERDGLEHASLRTIAAEAGLAIGSVRHYFDDHADVLEFAMRELTDRLTQRIMGHVTRLIDSPPERDAVEGLLAEFLPLDPQRHLECTAWLAFTNAARTRPTLRPYARELHDGLRMIIGRVMQRLEASGLGAFDVALETERTAAMLDGLTMAVVLQPGSLNADTARAVLRRHLDSLFAH
jgi:AcrR family transcriptional regulator